MKIVCDACQAKYSIADEKVQGKAFKIRCKKCGHIIVVRTNADRPAATAESKPAPAADQQGVWYIVVEGEQVGPLAEADIAGRLSRGEINPDTLVWKDGLADWVKISTVPELGGAAAAQPAAPAQAPVEPTPPPAAPIPARRRSSARMQAAKEPVRAAAPVEDVFKPAAVAPGAADLFAPSVAMQAPVSEPAAPFAFGATAAPAPEPVPQQAPPSDGAGQSHLTGQRNENSVLFSLSNLEALAVPSGSTNARPPSTTSTTEGSGLIDIRSMAARTIGQTSRSDSPGAMDSLPTFSTPQFSPVAPVLLPLAPSGPPKWVYPVLGVLGLGIVGLGFGIYKVVSAPPPAPPPQIIVPAPIAAPAPAPAPAAAPAAAAAPSAEPAKPAAPSEKPAEEKTASEKKKPSGKGARTVARSPSEGSAKPASDTSNRPSPEPTAVAAKPTPKRGGSIDDLLDQVGPKKPAGEAKPARAPSAAPLAPLSQSDIVNAMKGVQPRVKECFNQYKQPGIANVSISVARGGRVASATVSGKFAGTPSGSCVEAAAKTAKFPPCEAMSFPWPFQLR